MFTRLLARVASLDNFCMIPPICLGAHSCFISWLKGIRYSAVRYLPRYITWSFYWSNFNVALIGLLWIRKFTLYRILEFSKINIAEHYHIIPPRIDLRVTLDNRADLWSRETQLSQSHMPSDVIKEATSSIVAVALSASAYSVRKEPEISSPSSSKSTDILGLFWLFFPIPFYTYISAVKYDYNDYQLFWYSSISLIRSI